MIKHDRYLVSVRYADVDYDPSVDELEFDTFTEAVNAASTHAMHHNVTVTLQKITVLGVWLNKTRIA